jgi:hypothetical protein
MSINMVQYSTPYISQLQTTQGEIFMCSLIRRSVYIGSLLPLLASAGTSISLVQGWNLVGNSDSAAIQVASSLNNVSKITSVWKWKNGKWAFYTPSMTDPVALATYAAGKGYDVLTQIDPKEGFWVNASAATVIAGNAMATPPVPGSVTASLVATDLADGWNLVASADNKNPSQINTNLSPGLAVFGKTLVTAWGWDAPTSSWKFYAPGLEAQGATTLSNYISGKAYRSFAMAPEATEGFWVNVTAVVGTTGTTQAPLDAAKTFINTLRSNAMALDAADLSLQTELQAVANDLKNRTVPIASSNLNALNLAIKGLQFWDEVINSPTAPFVANKTFYESTTYPWETPTPIGGCGFYSDVDYYISATSKADAKYLACGTAYTQANDRFIVATDANGVTKQCTALGEWCGTYWSTRVRLHPDAQDANKFTLYTQTRAARQTTSALGYSYYDQIQGKWITGLVSCPSGQACSYGVSATTAANTNYGAVFPGNAAVLTFTRDNNTNISGVSLTGELSPGFSIQSNPMSSFEPTVNTWVYRPNQIATVLGDKHNVALSAVLAHLTGLDKLDLSGSIDLIKNTALETRIELAPGSYMQARPAFAGSQNYTAHDGSQEMLLKLKAGSATSSFTGDVKVGAFKSDASGTNYMPTQVSFAGSVQRNGVSFFEGTVMAENLNYPTFNAQFPPSSINVQTGRLGFVGNVIIPNRPALNVTLGITSKMAGGPTDASLMSGQYAQGTSIVNVSGYNSGLTNRVTLESPGGVKLVIDPSKLVYPLTKSGTLVGEYSTQTRVLTYTDNSYEQF